MKPEEKKIEAIRTYKFPDSVCESWEKQHGETGPKTIGLRASKLSDEKLAMKKSINQDLFNREMTKLAVVELDGKPADFAEVETFFGKAPLKYLELITAAWLRVNTATRSEMEDFLDSEGMTY